MIYGEPSTWAYADTVPYQPAQAPPTSVYSLMVEIDPDLPEKVAQGQQEMKKLAVEAMVFYATAPFTAIALNPKGLLNYDYVTAQAAKHELQAAQFTKQLAQTKSTTQQINLAHKIKQLLLAQQTLLSWGQKLNPPGP